MHCRISPETNDELISFICMMQSNTDFKPTFAKEAVIPRELIKDHTKYEWQDTNRHLETFLNSKKKILLAYYNMNKHTYRFKDTHVTGFGAMFPQGETTEEAKPIALASRGTSKAETCCPRITPGQSF